jgi:hypothetical protein
MELGRRRMSTEVELRVAYSPPGAAGGSILFEREKRRSRTNPGHPQRA